MDSILDKVKQNIKVDPDTGCWVWQKSKNERGYGRIYAGGKIRKVHRVVYEAIHGPLGELNCLHTCDNPPCCNPDHLFSGTDKDNVRDCISKGRFPFNHKNNFRKVRGSEVGTSTLTEALVLKMKSEYKPYSHLIRDWSKKYGLSANTIRRAITGKSWKHVS